MAAGKRVIEQRIFSSLNLITMKNLFMLYLLFLFSSTIECIGEVIYAVNCGSGAHTDLNGVHYQADRLSVGTASDYGKSLQIERAAPADQILYQTERYHAGDFGYTVPITDEGEFVLVLKFSEVYFRGSKLKVDILNFILFFSSGTFLFLLYCFNNSTLVSVLFVKSFHLKIKSGVVRRN